LVLCEDEEELNAWEQVSEALNAAAWDTLEQLILIGMAAENRKTLVLPAGNGYFVQVILPTKKAGSNHSGYKEGTPPSEPEPKGEKLLSAKLAGYMSPSGLWWIRKEMSLKVPLL